MLPEGRRFGLTAESQRSQRESRKRRTWPDFVVTNLGLGERLTAPKGTAGLDVECRSIHDVNIRVSSESLTSKILGDGYARWDPLTREPNLLVAEVAAAQDRDGVQGNRNSSLGECFLVPQKQPQIRRQQAA